MPKTAAKTAAKRARVMGLRAKALEWEVMTGCGAYSRATFPAQVDSTLISALSTTKTLVRGSAASCGRFSFSKMFDRTNCMKAS